MDGFAGLPFAEAGPGATEHQVRSGVVNPLRASVAGTNRP